MRWAGLLLCAVGCAFVDGDDALRRMDVDADQIPVTVDCDDTDPRVGSFADLSFEPAAEGWDCPEVLICGAVATCGIPASTSLDTSLCEDPFDPGRVLPFDNLVRVHRLQAGSGDAVLRLRSLANVPLPDAPSEPADRREIVMMANRGATCGLDRCTLGFPLRNARAQPPVGEYADLTLSVTEDEDWYVVVSRSAGYTLTVECL